MIIQNNTKIYEIINLLQSLNYFKINFLLKNDNSDIFISFIFNDNIKKTNEEVDDYIHIINNILQKYNINTNIYYKYKLY